MASKLKKIIGIREKKEDAVMQAPSHSEQEGGGLYDDSPVKFLTVRSFLMGVLVSMGGFIFGYDTGMYILNPR